VTTGQRLESLDVFRGLAVAAMILVASLLYTIAYVALWAAVMTVMYRKRVFVGI